MKPCTIYLSLEPYAFYLCTELNSFCRLFLKEQAKQTKMLLSRAHTDANAADVTFNDLE